MSSDQINDSYLQIVMILRRMLIDCNLVHADFSEYNLLYLNDVVWVIDVSQSVEKDHPYSFEFLKRDIFNINSYYTKLGLSTFKLKSLFNFVSDPLLTEEQLEEEIEKMKEEAMEDPDQEKETTDFMLYEIPRTLSMLEDIDEINAKLETIKSNLDTLIFGRFLGSDERILKGVVYDGEDAEVSEGEPIEEEELLRMIEEAKEERKEKKNLPPKESTKFDPFKDMTKAERQKKVKEENRDKRIIKIPKHVRKAIIKKTSGKQT